MRVWWEMWVQREKIVNSFIEVVRSALLFLLQDWVFLEYQLSAFFSPDTLKEAAADLKLEPSSSSWKMWGHKGHKGFPVHAAHRRGKLLESNVEHVASLHLGQSLIQESFEIIHGRRQTQESMYVCACMRVHMCVRACTHAWICVRVCTSMYVGASMRDHASASIFPLDSPDPRWTIVILPH